MLTLVVLPTYDEAENIDDVLRQIRRAVPEAWVLVVDDGSPDGTADLADSIGVELGRVEVLRRSSKDGLGAAYRAGFAWALEHGYATIGQMDCDLSHPPAALARLVAAMANGADVVVGSRYTHGGGTEGWPLHRRAMSRVGCVAARLALGLPYSDLSGGFKLWTAAALRAIDVTGTRSGGYVFQVETTQRAHRAGLRVAEVPFVFRDRVAGTSKMAPAIAVEGARMLVGLRRDPWRPATA